MKNIRNRYHMAVLKSPKNNKGKGAWSKRKACLLKRETSFLLLTSDVKYSTWNHPSNKLNKKSIKFEFKSLYHPFLMKDYKRGYYRPWEHLR